MSLNITEVLRRWIEDGVTQIGQVAIVPTQKGYRLRHIEDVEREDLESFSQPEEARHLATYDDEGRFRPLRTPPSLRHGWCLNLSDIEALRIALDHFYPSMLGVLASYEKHQLLVTDLRNTLGRQSGMYAVTKKVTEEEAQATISSFCKSQGGCLKTILWRISPEAPVKTLPAEKFDPGANQTGVLDRAIPMLCHEACNLLVAQIRTVVKGR